MLKLLKYIYFTIIFAIFSLAMFIVLGGTNPFYKIDDVTQKPRINKIDTKKIIYNKNDKTLITPEGNITFKNLETIDSYNFVTDINRRNLVIHYDFLAKEDIKPNVLFDKYINVYQNGNKLSDGGISADVGTEKFEDLSNNTVKRLKKGEKISGVKIINYDIQGENVDIKYNDILIDTLKTK